MLVKDFLNDLKENIDKDSIDRLWILNREILNLEETLGLECEWQDFSNRVYCELLEKYKFNISQMNMSIDSSFSSIKNLSIKIDQEADPELAWDFLKYYENILIQRKILLISVKNNCPGALQKYKKLIAEQNSNDDVGKQLGLNIYQEFLLKNSAITFK
ncbi:uncharacterized protein LOC129607541 [Condylostylus longicornis]|uniref:uncharacterized protein LOC129607541 n=1 Tax=Condylostylus longicornis TaxID=2530218 RepID=UPI00244D9ED9|nr:uncharacterized protein LOC129607541 [Condylostylus longicornis]